MKLEKIAIVMLFLTNLSMLLRSTRLPQHPPMPYLPAQIHHPILPSDLLLFVV